jgi:hypothetical protein
MPIFDVYLARTYRVRMVAPDEALAERLAEEFVGEVKDRSTPEQRAGQGFRIQSIDTVDNHAFDAILVEER